MMYAPAQLVVFQSLLRTSELVALATVSVNKDRPVRGDVLSVL